MTLHLNAIEWLCKKGSGYDALSQEERDVIMQFALLWSYFESKALDTNASASKIVELSKLWENKKQLKIESFESLLSYFRNRYVQNGVFTTYFDALRLRRNDNKQLVEDVLKGKNKNIGDIVAALLIIVYRLRNNLFHGAKWGYGISGQLNNFTNANELLMHALDLDD